MTDLLLSEVNEALRQDSFAKLWNTWKKPLLWVCVALVVGTGISSIRDYYREKKGAVAMEQLSMGAAAYGRGDYTNAEKSFAALVETSHDDIRDMARLWQARALTQQKKTDAAIAVLTTLAENASGDNPIWRDLACLRLEGLASTDLPKPCESTSRATLKAQRDTWRAARLYQQGKAEAAATVLEAVARDKTANPNERAQAQSLLAVFAAMEGTK
jgi:hypothetical protein